MLLGAAGDIIHHEEHEGAVVLLGFPQKLAFE
jgi:hypothetical protein